MTIAIDNKKLKQAQFTNEYELQGYLERCPYLLAVDDGTKVASIKREVRLPYAGNLDLLLVDDLGTPIAVEVKLARNSQARREVVAQAFDYVSDLSQITVDELDDLVDGALESAFNSFKSEQNLWKNCGTNLRAGAIKVIIAVDQANEDLIRIVRYINDRSDLDVRLVEIKKYNDGNILVPNVIVAGNQKNDLARKPKSPTVQNLIFENIIENYNSQAIDELKTRTRAKNYRQIRFDHWPSTIHYEFIDYKGSNQIAVDLHLEGDKVKFLGSTLHSFEGKTINGMKIEWDGKWARGRGRIGIRISSDSTPEIISKAMHDLIELTADVVDKKLTDI